MSQSISTIKQPLLNSNWVCLIYPGGSSVAVKTLTEQIVSVETIFNEGVETLNLTFEIPTESAVFMKEFREIVKAPSIVTVCYPTFSEDKMTVEEQNVLYHKKCILKHYRMNLDYNASRSVSLIHAQFISQQKDINFGFSE